MKFFKPIKHFPIKITRTACIIGVITFTAFTATLIITGVFTKFNIFGQKDPLANATYAELLDRFDSLQDELNFGLPVNPEFFLSILNMLEKKALGAEATLSVLKRYRYIANINTDLTLDYCAAVERATEKFPNSALLCALGSEALLLKEEKDGSVIPNLETKLLEYADVLSHNGVLSENSFFPLVFCIYSLTSVFDNIDSSLQLNRVHDIFASYIRENRDDETAITNAAVLNIAAGNLSQAAVTVMPFDIQTMQSEKAKRFMAEYSYDFANPLAAAQLWFNLGSDVDISRAADAFVLADDYAGARNLWGLLTKKTNSNRNKEDWAAHRTRLFYNLAATTDDVIEKREALRGLFAAEEDALGETPSFMFGVIAWSQTMEDDLAIQFLEDSHLNRTSGVLDLEIFKRQLNSIPVTKTIADTWLLLNKFPKSPDIYNWACWYFSFMRQRNEVEALKYFASQNKVVSQQLLFLDALDLMSLDSEDYTERQSAALEILKNLQVENRTSWAFYANAALIYEAKRQFREAASAYQVATELIELHPKKVKSEKAAKVFFKMALCYKTLNDPSRQRAALERAYDFAPGDVQVRLALSKL
ncbi:MAG: hypothetical protein Ta2G_14620 [Termitinemataceae bacterium]|nr:MAG: hypothetical protein Ta2G_14620 [Termitinemataceae bacterium]